MVRPAGEKLPHTPVSRGRRARRRSTMKLCLTVFTALLFCAATAGVSYAADKPADSDKADKSGAADKAAKGDADTADKPKKAQGLRGKVVKVDGDKVVLSTGGKKNAKEVTVTTDSKTKVMIDGKAATLADLKEGQQVAIRPAEGTAKAITVGAPAAKKDKADGADQGKAAEKAEEKAPAK